MMKRVRNIMALAPLVFLAATCVTDVRQKGEAGPWVGEVVNYSAETTGNVRIEGRLIDARGREVTYISTDTCPSQLEPGQQGTFEIFTPEMGQGPDGQPPFTPPLRFEITNTYSYPVPDSNPFRGEGLTVRLVETDRRRNFVLLELRNQSPFTYWNTVVCANLRTADGTLAEVGSDMPFPQIIRPGETQQFPIFFNSMPNGEFEFFALGQQTCCGVPTLALSNDAFKVTATRIFEGPAGRALHVVGELQNPTGQDLGGLALTAHASTSWADRTEFQTIGCNGAATHDATVPVAFTIPLRDSARDAEVVLEGIQASQGQAVYPLELANIVLASPRPEGDGLLETRRVSVTMINPTSSWIQIIGVCIGLRDTDGRLVGALNYDGLGGQYMQPGTTLGLAVVVEQLASSATAEVIAYGQPSQPPPTPVAVPH